MKALELPEGYVLRVTTSSGDVRVIAEDRADVLAPDDARVHLYTGEETPAEEGPDAKAREERREERRERREGRRRHRRSPLKSILKHVLQGAIKKHHRPQGPALEIGSRHGGSEDIEVRCPAGTPLSVGTLSGDIRLEGEMGHARVATASGDITVDRAASLDARSISGDLEVNACPERCRLSTKSGHIEARDTGAAVADTVSGRIRLDRTAGPVKVRTVSGNVELGTDGSDSVSVRSVSGGVNVRVDKERRPETKLRSVSGKVTCDCPEGDDFPLEVMTVSGNVEVAD